MIKETRENTSLVSVVMTTYNRAGLIGESIQSVINQTYPYWELIIVDDGSDDQTQNVIRQYHDDRIQYYYLEHTGLLGGVRNYGIRRARGEYIAFQDSDDLWREDKLDFQIRLFKEYPGSFFVLTNNTQFGENATAPPDHQALFVGNLFLPILEQRHFHFCGTSLIFRKEVIKKIGLLEETIPMMRELHFFFRMSREFTGIFSNERLVSVRRHSYNTSNRYSVNAHITGLKMLEEFFNDGALSKKKFKHLASASYYKMGLLHIRQKESLKAAGNFLQYIRAVPWHLKGWIRLIQSIFLSVKL